MSSAILVAVVLPLLAVVSSSHAATLHAFQIGVLKDSPSQVIVAGKGFVTVHRPCSIRDFRMACTHRAIGAMIGKSRNPGLSSAVAERCLAVKRSCYKLIF